jgi:hypothetical protein
MRVLQRIRKTTEGCSAIAWVKRHNRGLLTKDSRVSRPFLCRMWRRAQKMEALCTSETLVNYRTTWRHIPEHTAVIFMRILLLNIRRETGKGEAKGKRETMWWCMTSEMWDLSSRYCNPYPRSPLSMNAANYGGTAANWPQIWYSGTVA